MYRGLGVLFVDVMNGGKEFGRSSKRRRVMEIR